MRLLFCIIAIFVSACGPQPQDEPQKIKYKITPQNKNFLIEISHDGDQRARVQGLDPTAYEKHQILTGTQAYPITYTVTPTTSEPRVSDTIMKLEDGFFQTVGHGFLMCVGKETNRKKSIQIIWNAPANWKFANSFSANQKEQNFEATCNELRKGLYVGGYNFRLQETQFGALALRGDFTDAALADIENTLTRNMQRVLDFWESKFEPYYFVSMRTTDSKTHGGTAQFQSFQIDLPQQSLDPLDLDRLITHEFFHHWNGFKINLAPYWGLDHLDVWWFVEGFTDYYAYLLSGAPDTEKFNNVSLVELKRNYLTNDTYSGIPYIQGRKIAQKLDTKIQNFSKKKLKHVMHEIIRLSQKDSSFYLTRENILKVICEGRYMSCLEATEILKNHVDLGMSF